MRGSMLIKGGERSGNAVAIPAPLRLVIVVGVIVDLTHEFEDGQLIADWGGHPAALDVFFQRFVDCFLPRRVKAEAAYLFYEFVIDIDGGHRMHLHRSYITL